MKKWVITILLGAFAATPGRAESNELMVYTSEMGAYSNPVDEQAPGMMIELIQAMALQSNMKINLSIQPWKRAVSSVATNKGDGLIFPLIRSPGREAQFAWIVEVLHDRKVFFCRKDHREDLSQSQLLQANIGVIRGSPFHEQLERMEYKRVDATQDAATNARKLAKGRIDYWYVTYNTAVNTFDELKIARNDFKVCHANEHIPIYMAGNLNFPVAKAEKLKAAFAELKKNGFVDRLLKKYQITDAGEGPGRTSHNTKK